MNELIEIKNSGSFTQANELIRATRHMDELSHKLYFFCLAKRGIGQSKIESDATEIRKVLNIPKTGKNLKEIWQALSELQERTMVSVMIPIYRHELYEDLLQLGANEDEKVIIKASIIEPVLTTQSKKIIFKINPMFIPLLDNLKKEYGWAYLEKIAKLKKKYSVRIYEWIEMKLGTQDAFSFIWYFDKDKDTEGMGIRQFLGIVENKYKLNADLRRRVLEPAFNEIEEKLNFKIDREYLINEQLAIYAVDINVWKTNSETEFLAVFERCCLIKPALRDMDFQVHYDWYMSTGLPKNTRAFECYLLN